MRKLLGSLRLRLSVAVFLTSYTPLLVMMLAFAVFDSEETSGRGLTEEQLDVLNQSSIDWSFAAVVAVVLVPVVAAFAWWLSGRAVRPHEQPLGIQEALVEEMSHELRTPLAILVNNADVILAQPEPTPEIYRSGLERSRKAAKRMTTTIDSLLVDARGRARQVRRETVDVTQIVNGIADALQPVAISSEVRVRVEPAGALTARVDEAAIERAVSNLVDNAIEASAAGTTVIVTLEASEDTVTVAVTDEGDGIAPKDHARVFDRYWQGSSTTGVGLGLAIVKQIAAAHGGSVSIDSPVADGRGSTIAFTVSR